MQGRLVWPPGLHALRKVAIYRYKEESIDPINAAPLFLLPSIESIHLEAVFCYNEDDRCAEILSPRSSSVQHLRFDEPVTSEDVYPHNIATFIASAKNLQTLVFQDVRTSASAHLVKHAIQCHGESLETLLIQTSTGFMLRSSGPTKYSTHDFSGSNLRVVTLNLFDVIRGSRLHFSGGVSLPRRRPSNIISDPDQFVDYFRTSLPRTVETLTIDVSEHDKVDDSDMDIIDTALALFIEQEHRSPKLMTVYLDNVDGQVGQNRLEMNQDPKYSERFPRTVACGKKRGVNIFTEGGQGFARKLCEKLFDMPLNLDR